MVLQIGYKASAEQFGARELADYAVRAEEVGLDSVSISDHFLPWRETGGHAPNSLAWLAHVGARTARVRLQTSVLTPTFRYQPAVVAQTFATLGCLYPGRVVLGVGTGEALNEVAVTGAEWPEFKQRFARLREAVRLIRQLWGGGHVSFEGEYYRTKDAVIYDLPETPVPIYVAGGGPTMARYAGRSAEGFICTSGKGHDLYADKLLPAVAAGLAKNDRSQDQLDRMIEIKLSWDPDPDRALENTRFWAPLSLTAEQKHSVHSSAEMEAAADALDIQTIAQRWIVSSDAEEITDRVREYTDLGFNHLIIHAPGHDQERFLSTFADRVLPGLRGLTPGRLPGP